MLDIVYIYNAFICGYICIYVYEGIMYVCDTHWKIYRCDIRAKRKFIDN